MRVTKLKNVLVGIIFIFIIWSLLYYSKIFSPILLPEPFTTIKYSIELIYTSNINKDIITTIYRWIIGFIIGLLLAIPFGLLLGSSKKFHDLFDFSLDFFRSLPVTALFPLFLLLFGIGDESKIAMVFAATFPIIAINSYYGVIHSSKKRVLMAKSFGANKYDIFRRIVFWEALPHIFVGMRLAVSASLIVIIISEMFIGTQFGLGQRLFDAYSTNRTLELYSILVIIGIIGYTINKLFVIFENKALIWKK